MRASFQQIVRSKLPSFVAVHLSKMRELGSELLLSALVGT